MHYAAVAGHRAALIFLLDFGASADAQTRLGQSALHLAASNGHEEIAWLLLDRGVEVHANAFIGLTPLHLAAIAGHEEITSLFLKGGAESTKRNSIRPNHSDDVVFQNKLSIIEHIADLETMIKAFYQKSAAIM